MERLDMKEIDIDGLRKIQIEILDAVSFFCKENNIHYWLDSGTLIGAVRHKGYIPWDDDIDIGMLREDYDKFSNLFNQKQTRYKFKSVTLDRNFLYPYGKVLDESTILYEPDENGQKLSVNIDVFVYDNAPADDELVKKMYDQRDYYRNCFLYQTKQRSPYGKGIKSIPLILLTGIMRLLPSDYYVKKMERLTRKYSNQKTDIIGNFTGFVRFVCDKSVFDSFVDVEFEGRTYSAPAGYDQWLRAIYGNYMELPPIEKQVSHHLFKAYRID